MLDSTNICNCIKMNSCSVKFDAYYLSPFMIIEVSPELNYNTSWNYYLQLNLKLYSKFLCKAAMSICHDPQKYLIQEPPTTPPLAPEIPNIKLQIWWVMLGSMDME